MNNITVTVGSVTHAIKLRKLLSRGGIRSKLVKVEDSKNENGCTHGVEIKESDFYQAVVIMRANSVKYSVYTSKKL